MIPTRRYSRKGKIMEKVKQSVVFSGWEGEREMNWQSTEDFQVNVTIIFDMAKVDNNMHLAKPIELSTDIKTVNPNVYYEFQLIVMYQCWFINSKKYTIQMQGVKNGETEE